MEPQNELTHWLYLIDSSILGSDGDQESGNADNSSSSDSGSSDTEGETTSSESSTSNSSEEDNSGLKSALEKERKRARDAERELTRIRKAEEQAELAKKSELEQLQARTEASEARAKALADRLLKDRLTSAITRAATAQGFIDPTDATSGVDMGEIDFEQNEDDPSTITIDEKSIERAVKALAAKKPHFVRAGTDDGEPSGSQFGGSKRKEKNQVDQLREKYPSL